MTNTKALSDKLEIFESVIRLNNEIIYSSKDNTEFIFGSIPFIICTKCNKSHLNIYFMLFNKMKIELCEISEIFL